MVQRPRSATAGLPPGVEPRRSLSHLAVGLLLAFAVLLGTLLYYAQFSGGVRWLLGVVTLAVLAAIVWSQIQRRTAEPSPLVGPPSPDATRGGELGAFAAAVRRADRGLPYSQMIVASRAQAAFLERARLALGLPSATLRDMRRDTGALRRIFGDDALVDFLFLEEHDPDDRFAWVRRARARGGFVPSSATSSREWRRGGEHCVRPGGWRRSSRCGRDGDRRQATGPGTSPLGDPRRRSSPDRGRPRAGEDAHREVVRRGPRPLVPSHSVYPGPAAGGHHRNIRVRPQERRLRPSTRPGLHERPPCGRDQPGAAEDPERAPRGDAGTPGDLGGRDVPPGPAVLRDRDAESD